MQIYVACLSSYNNGHLHGAWIDASSDVEDMQEGVNNMLAASPMQGKTVVEEWAIHDHEMPVDVSEYCGLQHIADIATFFEESDYDDEVTRAALEVACGIISEAERHLENYVGHFETVEDLGYEYADICMEIPENIQSYFDYERYGADLACDMYEHNGHYFWCS